MENKINNINENEDNLFDAFQLRILLALRKIIRAVDIHSRKLNDEFKVTTPQMICLHAISKQTDITQTQLTKTVSLSKSTINGIIDRLETKQLLTRHRGNTDRRKVFLKITDKGRKLISSAPTLLQEQFNNSLKKLPELEQAAIALSLERVVELMNAEEIDASPNLISNNQVNSKKEIK